MDEWIGPLIWVLGIPAILIVGMKIGEWVGPRLREADRKKSWPMFVLFGVMVLAFIVLTEMTGMDSPGTADEDFYRR